MDLASEIGVRADLPPNDPIDLAARFGKTEGRAPAAKPFAGEAEVGTTRDFTVARISGASIGRLDAAHVATMTATLVAKSAHAYFYVDNVLNADGGAAQQAADEFEANVWPVVTGVFGDR